MTGIIIIVITTTALIIAAALAIVGIAVVIASGRVHRGKH